MENLLNQKVTHVNGVGDAKAKVLSKLEIKTIYDLLTYFPRDFISLQNIDNEFEKDENAFLKLKVLDKSFGGHGYRKFLKLKTTNNKVFINLLFFNRNFYDDYIDVGDFIYVYGKFKKDRFGQNYSSSNFKIISPDFVERYSFLPIYKLTKGITTFALIKYVENAFNQFGKLLEDFMPDKIVESYNIPSYAVLTYKMHFPKSIDEYQFARKYLVYIEFFTYLVQIFIEKNWKIKEKNIRKSIDYSVQNKFLKTLPFQLTKDQKSVLDELNNKYKENYLINSLIQGDVGSGKTVVAIGICMNYLQSNYQVAFMAPTEILARQHYKKFEKILKDLGYRPVLVTSSLTKKKKELEIQKIKKNDYDIIFGTHSLIQDSIEFNNLKLVIIDEQQKFGVEQRLKLRSKGKGVDLIVLSATPIPRSFSLTLYGDLDIVSIKKVPSNRKPVKTMYISDSRWSEIVSIVESELKKQHQVFFVYPAVEEENKLELKSAKEMFEKIKISFANYNVDICHGKMKDKEIKNKMEMFKDKNIDILVTTTIVGVGIDIPNATIMVIEEAERYGLSTLHQLRGRIGRGDFPGICILTTKKAPGKIAQKRIEKMLETTDGFEISNFDFKLRGPGEVFGLKQSGDIDFQIADLAQDSKIFNKAVKDANSFIKADPSLKQEGNQKFKQFLFKYKNVKKEYLLSG